MLARTEVEYEKFQVDFPTVTMVDFVSIRKEINAVVNTSSI